MAPSAINPSVVPAHSPQTLFVTVEVGSGVKALIELLRKRKIHVREAFDMEGDMRISVGLPRENEAIIEELRRIPIKHWTEI